MQEVPERGAGIELGGSRFEAGTDLREAGRPKLLGGGAGRREDPRRAPAGEVPLELGHVMRSRTRDIRRRRFGPPPYCASRRPPARRASWSVRKRRGWSGIQWNVAVLKMASTWRPRWSSSRSAHKKTTRRFAPGNLALAAASIAGDRSTAMTSPEGKRSTSRAVSRPVPQPASITTSVAARSRRSRTRCPHPNWGSESWSYAGSVPICRLIQRWRVLRTWAARGHRYTMHRRRGASTSVRSARARRPQPSHGLTRIRALNQSARPVMLTGHVAEVVARPSSVVSIRGHRR